MVMLFFKSQIKSHAHYMNGHNWSCYHILEILVFFFLGMNKLHKLIHVFNKILFHLLDGKVRLATLELSCLLLKQSVLSGNCCIIKDVHLACLEVKYKYTHATLTILPKCHVRRVSKNSSEHSIRIKPQSCTNHWSLTCLFHRFSLL